jgi:FkbM family methyltransferase
VSARTLLRPRKPARPAPTPGFNVLTETRYGPMLYNRHDVYIGRSLELYGEWSEGEISLFRQVLRPGMVVVDAGANIGTHTVALAQAVTPSGQVWAFEPQRIVFQTLAANVALNSLTNVSCQPRALGAVPGTAQVPPINYTSENNFGGVWLGSWPNGESVEIVRIDDLRLPACHLLKIDVEGMELEVLQGAAATIAQHHPLLYVEIDRADKRDDVIRWLDARGYALYVHEVALYNPDNFKHNPVNAFPNVSSLNMLAVPATVSQTIAGLQRIAIPR